MNDSILIPRPGSVNGIFTIDRQDWLAVNAQVAAVISVEPIGDMVKNYIPNYPQLLAACHQWKSGTLLGLIAQAALVSMFGNKAADTLQQLSANLAGLSASDPVPSTISFIYRVHFAALADDASKIRVEGDTFGSQLDNFVSQMKTADETMAEGTPIEWSSVSGAITTIESTLNEVQGGWHNIADQLETLSSGQIEITTEALLAQDIGSAIASWHALADAAVNFDSVAATLP